MGWVRRYSVAERRKQYEGKMYSGQKKVLLFFCLVIYTIQSFKVFF